MVTTPLVGDNFIRGSLELSKALEDHAAQVNDTCGLHVHVDASNYTYWDIRRFLRIYSLFEDDIYRYLIAPSRSNNRFCGKLDTSFKTAINNMSKATNDSTAIKNILQETVFGIEWPQIREPDRIKIKSYVQYVQELKNNKYGGGVGTRARVVRYFGLNVFSWFHRGSLEFRMKEGTVDPLELVCWPLFCAWLVELSSRMHDSHVDKLPNLLDFLHYGVERSRFNGTDILRPPRFLYTWAQHRIRNANNEEE
jgi:hypothetical protein